MDYKIKSEYIKNKVQGHSFKNTKYRNYIQDLVFLEQVIMEGAGGFGGAMRFHGLEFTYEKDYEEIYKELKPDEYKKYMKEKKLKRLKEKRDRKKWKKREQQELVDEEKWWISYGGTE